MKIARIACVVLGLLLTAVPGKAQSRFGVGGGYDFTNFSTKPPVHYGGGFVQGSVTIFSTSSDSSPCAEAMRFVGQASAVVGSVNGNSTNIRDFLFGPEFAIGSDRVQVFGHFLFGGAKARLAELVNGVGAQGTSFAMGLGGGIDIKLMGHAYLRAAQIEDISTNFDGQSQNNVRVQTGFIFRF